MSGDREPTLSLMLGRPLRKDVAVATGNRNHLRDMSGLMEPECEYYVAAGDGRTDGPRARIRRARPPWIAAADVRRASTREGRDMIRELRTKRRETKE